MPKRGENIHKRKDGRWEGRIIEGYRQDGKAKYRSLYGASYYEVKQKQRQAQQDPGRLALPNPGKPVGFREVLFLWLDDSKIKLRPATSDKYLRMINDHLLESLGGYRIDRLNAMTINKFIDEKKAIGRKDKNGGLSSGYIKTLIYIIQAALKYATNNRLCPPLIGDIHKPKQTKSEIQLLTLEEQSRLEQTLLFETDSAKMAVLISLQSGLRIGEVCGLHWDDIDFQNKTLYVRRTISRIKNPSATANQSKTILIEGEPKSENSHRVIPLTQTLLDSLSLYRKDHGLP